MNAPIFTSLKYYILCNYLSLVLTLRCRLSLINIIDSLGEFVVLTEMLSSSSTVSSHGDRAFWDN